MIDSHGRYGSSTAHNQIGLCSRDAIQYSKYKKIHIIAAALYCVHACRWILKELGGDLTEDDIDEMIRDTDKDGSGYVDFDGALHSRTQTLRSGHDSSL